MSLIIADNSKDQIFALNPELIPVPVIASFNKRGDMIPLYFSYEGLRLKVDNIKWKDSQMILQEKFCCEVTLMDRVQEVILHYHRKYDIWTMERLR